MMTDGHGHTWRLGGLWCHNCGAARYSRMSARTCPRQMVTPAFDTDTDLDVNTSSRELEPSTFSNFSLPDFVAPDPAALPAEAPCSSDYSSSSDFTSGSCDSGSSFDGGGGFDGGSSGGGGGGDF